MENPVAMASGRVAKSITAYVEGRNGCYIITAKFILGINPDASGVNDKHDLVQVFFSTNRDNYMYCHWLYWKLPVVSEGQHEKQGQRTGSHG